MKKRKERLDPFSAKKKKKKSSAIPSGEKALSSGMRKERAGDPRRKEKKKHVFLRRRREEKNWSAGALSKGRKENVCLVCSLYCRKRSIPAWRRDKGEIGGRGKKKGWPAGCFPLHRREKKSAPHVLK